MLKGRLNDALGCLETWGTIKALLEVWQEGDGLVVNGECTDIVELHSWLLPSIQNAHPDKVIRLGDIRIPETEAERDLLRLEIRAFLEAHSDRMSRVTPDRRVRQV
jgi:hypothetical protein